MAKSIDRNAHEATFRRLKDVRSLAIEHTIIARRLSRERRDIISDLIDVGFSQADIARELGVSRQAIQKMLAV